MSNIYRNKKILPFFLLPAFLFMAVYLYYPFFMNIISSFQNIRVLGEAGGSWNSPWYANYAEMVHDPVVGIALKNTGIMILVTIAGQVTLLRLRYAFLPWSRFRQRMGKFLSGVL